MSLSKIQNRTLISGVAAFSDWSVKSPLPPYTSQIRILTFDLILQKHFHPKTELLMDKSVGDPFYTSDLPSRATKVIPSWSVWLGR